MKQPDVPDNEALRIKALKELHILDTEPEERFDRVTRLAKNIFSVQIALVSLVDSHRQWFKSKAGTEVCETSRDISFCGHVILGDDIFIIEDASRDERFFNNPLVTGEPFIRFYAGCTIYDHQKNALGTLCIIDNQPRSMEERDKHILFDLARMIEAEIAAVELMVSDQLTQLANRRGFTLMAEKCLAICERNQLPATLIFIDLNHFKSINDEFGHAVGDSALVSFAKILSDICRSSDIVARIAGDEFIIFLHDATQLDAKKLINRIYAYVSDHNLQSKTYQLDFSHGIYSCSDFNSNSLEQMMEEADQRMYTDKKETKSAR